MSRSKKHIQRGFTLPEALIASVVLAAAVAGLSHALVAGHQQSYEAVHQGKAIALAETMIEEILSRDHAEPGEDEVFGPDAGESRRDLFDDVDDFDGHTEQPGHIADATGELYDTLYQVFSRSVSVEPVTLELEGLGGEREGVTVTVTVAEPGGRSWTVQRFIPQPQVDEE